MARSKPCANAGHSPQRLRLPEAQAGPGTVLHHQPNTAEVRQLRGPSGLHVHAHERLANCQLPAACGGRKLESDVKLGLCPVGIKLGRRGTGHSLHGGLACSMCTNWWTLWDP